jgi:SAM-dependent methyltransferase
MTTTLNGGIPNHGYTHWWTMFNPRQLLVHALLLKAIDQVGGERHRWEVREYALAAFQQYLRNQTMFTIWNPQRDTLEPMFANNNFHPKSTMVENCVFPNLGRGNWTACAESLAETLDWSNDPWELVSGEALKRQLDTGTAKDLTGKSEKASPHDPVQRGVELACGSSTDLAQVPSASFDLVVTDPPFGGLLHYSELSDYFYVWLRLVLKGRYPDYFTSEYTPKTLEAVSNRTRQPEDPDGYYENLLRLAWEEAHRILKPGGILAFTFHHSQDSPWVSVLKSLFEADFYLEATYPIRSDETKGEGSKPGTFGSQQIEFDIIHVCRKRSGQPEPVSWAKMRRQVVDDIRSLKQMLEHHQRAGLPEADLQVIRRGKALEYYSRHYGQVRKASGELMTVAEAMAGISLLLEEESGGVKQPPPGNCDPMTRQFLRIFHGVDQVPRDQMQKYLRGTSVAPSQFEELGWCFEKSKVFHMTSPLEVARAWVGKPRQQLTSDYDQAALLIGASFDDSGINVQDTLNNKRFQAHPARLARPRGPRAAADGERRRADGRADRPAPAPGRADPPHRDRVAAPLPRRRRGRPRQDHRDRAAAPRAGESRRAEPRADGRARRPRQQLAPRDERGLPPRLRGVRQRGRRHRPQVQRLRQARPPDRQHRHLKRPARIKRLLEAPPWDLVVFDEAHHLTAFRNGKKVTKTENYKLAEALKGHARDLRAALGDAAPGRSLPLLDARCSSLNPTLFKSPDDMVENRHRLNAVVFRRTKADACKPDGSPLFARRWVHTESFTMVDEERTFYAALKEYLEDGFALAKRQGNQGRALGFVMTIFQKIAASSFAAVRRTLRRRILMLTLHEAILKDQELDIDGRERLLDEARELIHDEFEMARDSGGPRRGRAHPRRPPREAAEEAQRGGAGARLRLGGR